MNSLKNLVFIAVLAAAACGVYMSLNRSTDSPASTDSGIKIDIPGMSGGTESPPPSFPTDNSLAVSSSAGAAPPFAPPATQPGPNPSSRGGAAPPFQAGPPSANPSTMPDGPSLFPPTGNQTPPATGVLASGPDTPARSDSSATVSSEHPTQLNIEAKMKAVSEKMRDGQMADAHLILSSIYGTPDVPADKSSEITHMLDEMAAEVIYSRQNLIEKPYHIQPGDTLDRIADQYGVPPLLLARINGLRDPQNLPVGRDIKVVRGPFSAQIDLGRMELTLMLQGRYAGRFPIGLGADHPKLEGIFIVRDKRTNPDSAATNLQTNAGTKFWIGLGDQFSLQGTSDPQHIKPGDGQGAIWLGDQDMDDVYGILSVGSRVTIKR